MSTFDRAAIGRLRDLCLKDGGWHYVAHVITECLDEIDRQAVIVRAAVDDVPGYPCGCSHELDGDGVITVVHTTCEAHRRAEAQVRRLRIRCEVISEMWQEDDLTPKDGRVVLMAKEARVGLVETTPGTLAETEGR